jgi:hypothetical protein
MWQGMWLEKVWKGETVHPIIASELLEQGLTRFVDGPKEMVLTETGHNILSRFPSPDYASKRY